MALLIPGVGLVQRGTEALLVPGGGVVKQAAVIPAVSTRNKTMWGALFS